MAGQRSRARSKKGIWEVLNSPLIILVMSTAILGGGAKLYSDHQEAKRDQIARRSELGKLLTEYHHRISALEDADRKLYRWLGSHERPRSLNVGDTREVSEFNRMSLIVSNQEWDILTGKGDYRPTLPEYAGVNLQIIALQIENVAEIGELETSTWRSLGFLNTPPPNTSLFVRATLPDLKQFGSSRSQLYAAGQIPLFRGQELTNDQEVMLGRDLETMMKESDEAGDRALEAGRYRKPKGKADAK